MPGRASDRTRGRKRTALAEQIFQHTFDNGLTLLAERMTHVRSATVYFLTPAGCAFDPADRSGLASVLTEMSTRGAGDRDAEALSLALDNLGVDRGESVGLLNLGYSGGTLARNLPETLALYADILRRPMLPEADLDPSRELILQDLLALDDSPQDMVMLELRKRFYPPPLNRDRNGNKEDLAAITIDDVRKQHRKLFRPNGTIISVAGNIEYAALVDQIGTLFGDWKRGDDTQINIQPNTPKSDHIDKKTEQTQIAVAFPSIGMTHPAYYAARGAIGVLSSGMSSRLFTEVREKRGLCYSVYASHETLLDRGSVFCYAGTRSERAQETLDVMIAELRKLKEGISDDERDRVKAGLKTSLIMQQESTSARAGAIARDWYYLNRVRTFDELQASIDNLSVQAMLGYVEEFPFAEPTVVTLGPAPLTIP
ncbi:pitrilysin family protein [soil metagenome]